MSDYVIGSWLGFFLLLGLLSFRSDSSGDSKPALWELDNLTQVGGHPVTVLGQPEVISTPGGKAILFDGKDDALIVDSNPLAGLDRFTVEVIFRPDPGGEKEQRFLHMQATETRRALIETRLTGENEWFLDTFLKSDTSERTLQAKQALHRLGAWYHAALVYDGVRMRHYVNRQLETKGPVYFPPLEGGQTSIGCRLNRVFWFKGAIRTVRVTPAILDPTDFLPMP
ncbi:MAG: LamG domain-containing protein [Acidobacteria bacterium]|nr:MAG: LamG domain-containing protein [Acidobacteriota bacterium]